MEFAGERRRDDVAVAGVIVKNPVAEQTPLFAELNTEAAIAHVVTTVASVIELVAL